MVGIDRAEAQDLTRFFELEVPEHLTFRLFGAGYGAEKYGTTHEGFELNQTITHEVSFIGRAIAYQIYQGAGFDSPLTPSQHSATRNFGRFEGGLSDFVSRVENWRAHGRWRVSSHTLSIA